VTTRRCGSAGKRSHPALGPAIPRTALQHESDFDSHCWRGATLKADSEISILARAAIRRVAEGLGLRYFLTLTLDPKKLSNPKFAVKHLRLCFNKFRLYLKREFGEAPSYICVLEFTQAGIPHLHILIDRYVPHAWISNTWANLGGGRIVFIKQVTIANVSRYLSKYLTKELLLSAPKGTRRITTARSIKLFPKFGSDISWELIKSSIWYLLEENRQKLWGLLAADRIKEGFFENQFRLFQSRDAVSDRWDGFLKLISCQFDEEHFLKSFEMPATV
jgi:hypothetical protein